MTIALIGCVLFIAVLMFLVIRGERRRAAIELELETHKITYTRTEEDERAARRHSVATSTGVVRGKAAEQLAPFMPDMVSRFAPGDWRFLGSPVDFVVFDGVTDDEVKRIVLVEVKTRGGTSAMTERQRQIKTGIDAGTIALEFEVQRIDATTARRAARLEARRRLSP
jgi:predicted Holliday junction resolvase-like endonuclease